MGLTDVALRYFMLCIGFPCLIGLVAVQMNLWQVCGFDVECILSEEHWPLSQDWWWWFVNFVSPAAITLAIIFSVSIQVRPAAMFSMEPPSRARCSWVFFFFLAPNLPLTLP
jgi:hypothetical protein